MKRLIARARVTSITTYFTSLFRDFIHSQSQSENYARDEIGNDEFHRDLIAEAWGRAMDEANGVSGSAW